MLPSSSALILKFAELISIRRVFYRVQKRVLFGVVLAAFLTKATFVNAQVPAYPVSTLRDVGVSEWVDASVSLQQAVAKANGRCLDGEGLTFFVSDTVRITGDVCLSNVKIVARRLGVNTKPFLTGSCPAVDNPDDRIDCGDRLAEGDSAQRLIDYAYQRVLFISADESGRRPYVMLDNVQIDRGDDPSSGSRTDAAGIWIEGASKIRLNAVDITGAGKGYGLLISDSADVEINLLSVHDLIWAPYQGDLTLNYQKVKRIGFNRITIRELVQDSPGTVRFVATRVQEQLACVAIFRTTRVVLRNTRIQRCMAQFDDADLPWQADGLDLANGTSNVKILGRTEISTTWEGLDIIGTGLGVDDISLEDVEISNSFSIGLKLGHKVTRVRARQTAIMGAGFAGVMIYGPVDGVELTNTKISKPGYIRQDQEQLDSSLGEGTGLLITEANATSPINIKVDQLIVIGGGECAYGVNDRGLWRPSIKKKRVLGCRSTLKSR